MSTTSVAFPLVRPRPPGIMNLAAPDGPSEQYGTTIAPRRSPSAAQPGGTVGKGRAHSAVANALRWRGPDSPEALNAQCSLRAAVIADLIARSLDEGLLTDAHRRDLAALLTGGAR